MAKGKANYHLSYLRVKPSKQTTSKQCSQELISLLACWRQGGVDAPQCASMVSLLAQCAGGTAGVAAGKGQGGGTINYMLRMMFDANRRL